MIGWFPDEPQAESRLVTSAPPLPAPPPPPPGPAQPPVTATFGWLGTHGGAGATSLRAGSGVGVDLGREWPNPEAGQPSAVALVCRSNTAGLDAAGQHLQAWTTSTVTGLTVIAVVVVADASTKPPRIVRDRIGDLRAVVPTVLNLGWIGSWRENPYTVHPDAESIGAQLTSLAADTLRP